MHRSQEFLRIAFLASGIALLFLLPAIHAGEQAQNPPQKKVAEAAQEEYTPEEYNACEAARDETDPAKKAALIIAFVEKWPKSKLLPYVTPLYDALLYDLNKAGNFALLGPLAENWLKYNPGSLQLEAYVFDAASKLSDNQKVVEYGEKIYTQKPSAQLASILYNTYDRLGNKPKKLEWQLRLIEYPEYGDNVGLLWGLVVEYSAKDLSKAAAYAERTLKALSVGSRPASVPEADWKKNARQVERGCHNIIGMNLYEQKKYPQAIEAFQRAVKVECYQVGYFFIGQCHWSMQQAEQSYDNFAVAELLGGDMTEQARQRCLEIYKAVHNGNDTGIDKVYRRARAVVDACKK